MNDFISAYAAAVATVALCWQVHEVSRRRRPSVSVDLRSSVLWDNVKYRWLIHIAVSNDGERPVHVTQVTVRQGKGLSCPAKSEDLPGVIPAGEERSASYSSSEPGAKNLDPFLPVQASLRLAGGKWIYSKHAYLGDLIAVPSDILDGLRDHPDYTKLKEAIMNRIKVEGLLNVHEHLNEE